MKRPLRASSRSPYAGDPPPENWIELAMPLPSRGCQRIAPKQEQDVM